jgi:anti-sigma B factor antagonist
MPARARVWTPVPGAACTLSVRGELDMGTAPAIERELLQLCDSHGYVRVNLAALAFIEAAGLHALVGAARRARRQGRRLEVTRPAPPTLRRLVALTGVGTELGL